MNDEAGLLRRYAENGDQQAFKTLVKLKLGLVFNAALRRTSGDRHRAGDVVQQVFIALAKNAHRLRDHPSLSAWLHCATRNAASKIMISEERRKIRELAAGLHELQEPTPDWQQIRGVLDSAIDELPDAERSLIISRYLEKQSYPEMADSLGLSADALRMRCDRGLERLREILGRRGIRTTADALSAIIIAQAPMSAPAGMAASISATALASVTLFTLMSTKMVIISAIGLALGFVGGRLTGPEASRGLQSDAKAALTAEKVEKIDVTSPRAAPFVQEFNETAEEGGKRGARERLRLEHEFRTANPGYDAALIAKNKRRIIESYGDLSSLLGVDRKTAERILELTSERFQLSDDIHAYLQSKGENPYGANFAVVAKAESERVKQELADLITPEQAQLLELAPLVRKNEIMISENLSNELRLLNSSMTGDSTRQLAMDMAALRIDNAKVEDIRIATGPDAFLTDVNLAVLTSAKAYLTSTQLQALKAWFIEENTIRYYNKLMRSKIE